MGGGFTPKQHFGFEAAAWYWHFVDVVWLFLFAFIYVIFSLPTDAMNWGVGVSFPCSSTFGAATIAMYSPVSSPLADESSQRLFSRQVPALRPRRD
jgi:hypothetical protein